MKKKLLIRLFSIVSLIGIVSPLMVHAQNTFFEQLMSTSDKMFLTVIVLLIIFLGIIFALVRLDSKLKKLEDKF